MQNGSETFDSVVNRHGVVRLQRESAGTVQINVGKLCNQACHHCHVEAGPKRTEIMSEATGERVLALLGDSSVVATVDLTGGAPELNPAFRRLVSQARALGLRVIDRCNLTVLFEEGMEWLPEFLGEHRVELICSLPCYSAENVDQQRGGGVFDKSIRALQQLVEIGYGDPSSGLTLNLVYNPTGASLPPPQAELEATYREQLRERFSIEFNSLLTITNVPIKRFADQLQRWGEWERYMGLLVNHFNPDTLDRLMCRNLVSIGWKGDLYDCDFNQVLEISLSSEGRKLSLSDIQSFDELSGTTITTGDHCFACTAGTGSSCGGALT